MSSSLSWCSSRPAEIIEAGSVVTKDDGETSPATCVRWTPQKANTALTQEERAAKRDCKKELKRQRKRMKLETKLRQAIRRKDGTCIVETRKALQAFESKDNKGYLCEDNEGSEVGTTAPPDESVLFIEDICKHLQKNHSTSSKEVESFLASSLLRHMTKGTQSHSMFKDPVALWGYVRQKFFRRARLVCSSFKMLEPALQPNNLPAADRELRREVWEQLRTARRICSLGCGPGNDVVGVVAFLKAYAGAVAEPFVEQAILLDWAISDWNVVLGPLRERLERSVIQKFDQVFCDVSKSMACPVNALVPCMLLSNSESTSGCSLPTAPVNLVLISYLLTELRGQWESFLTDLMNILPSKTLIYFAEPTPWQLHRVSRLFAEIIDFLWVDSSMNQPELQSLDNRLGPAVLIARKR